MPVGVIVSYFEWKQNLSGEIWAEAEVINKLKKLMRNSADNVFALAKEMKFTLRQSAFILGMRRIVETEESRGRL